MENKHKPEAGFTELPCNNKAQSTLGFRNTKNVAKGTLEEVIPEVLQANQNQLLFVYTCPMKPQLPLNCQRIQHVLEILGNLSFISHGY